MLVVLERVGGQSLHLPPQVAKLGCWMVHSPEKSVPGRWSPGDRTILGRISKRGNGYLRTLFMQAARVILLRSANWPKHGFGLWLVRAAQRLHPNVLAAALANKLARIAWTVLAQDRSYEARVTKAAA